MQKGRTQNFVVFRLTVSECLLGPGGVKSKRGGRSALRGGASCFIGLKKADFSKFSYLMMTADGRKIESLNANNLFQG